MNTTTSPPSQPLAAAWTRLIPGVVLLAVLLLLFRETATAMVTIWIRSETFTHAFLVPPISMWLAWQLRAPLAATKQQPMPWLLLVVVLVCLAWLAGELVTSNAMTQFALVSLIVLCVPALYGWAITRVVLFPLLFLYFAVPLGEFLVPVMMERTADVTVLALQLSGIPVYRDGLQFVIPSGNWSVVQACSGVRYLIASFMVGTLFAYINFTSTKRRLMFVAVSIIVPVVANWVRAYMIVMLGHLSGNKIAAGADHLIYGWVFFGIVIMVMFMIGARWSEPAEDEAMVSAASALHAVAAPADWMHRPTSVLVATVLVLAATQAFMWRLQSTESGSTPVLALPQTGPGSWATTAVPSSWKPGFNDASAVAQAGYSGTAGTVGVWVGYYRDQGAQRKLVTSTNTVVAAKDDAWSQVGSGQVAVPTATEALRARAADLRSSLASGLGTGERLRVWQLYWVGGRLTASDIQAKLYLALERLAGRGDDGAVLMLYTPVGTGSDPTAATLKADAVLRAFAQDRLPALRAALSATQAAH